MPLRICCLLFSILPAWKVAAQNIVDPCFASVNEIGFFFGSEDVVNLCLCPQYYLATDMLIWDGTKWIGALSPEIDIQPPAGCNIRALWVGYYNWTPGGEAFGLRLDRPLEEGKTYSYSFTYAKETTLPNSDKAPFSPVVYTDSDRPNLRNAYKVGQLPATVDWTNETITFTASTSQAGHEWLILHAIESSGIILSDCEIDDAIYDDHLKSDTTLCLGDSTVLTVRGTKGYDYYWNTGEVTPSITVRKPGLYKVDIETNGCFSSDSIQVDFIDCEVRFEMPNIFTPNDDSFNPKFVPRESNMIDSATVRIYNRWGELLFSGDALEGWDGTTGGIPASPGVYYYIVNYSESNGTKKSKRGSVTLLR